MAGHSKWNNIRHKKAKEDSKRSKIWSKCARALMAAARQGGPDPAMNLSLRYAIDEARYANMPRDTIERAIKKGAGELGAANFESVRYEGYGPNGVAVVVDALTDNRSRTAPDVRHLFSKHGGNMGQSGSVAYIFETRGQIVIDSEKTTAEKVMDTAIEAGADDITEPESPGDPWIILTDPTEFAKAKETIEAAGLPIIEAAITMIPNMTVSIDDQTDAEKLIKLIDALEDNEDVQKVYANFELADHVAQAIGQ